MLTECKVVIDLSKKDVIWEDIASYLIDTHNIYRYIKLSCSQIAALEATQRVALFHFNNTHKRKYMIRKKTHPGEIIKHDYMEPLSITVSDLSQALNISEQNMLDILNKKSPITIEIAKNLARIFNTTEQLWLGLQQGYDSSC